jgi:hypothetical protein
MGAEEGQPPQPPQGGEGPPPTEDELRARLEDELRKLRVQDVLLQSVVSLINLTSRRIAKEDEQDLEQARIGIDAVRALVDLLDPEPAEQVRNALSELQVHYASAAGGGEPPPPEPPDGGDGGGGGEPPEPPSPPPPGGPGGKPPPKLWTPPGA